MTPPLPVDDSLSPADLELVIARCDQFEHAWRSARPLRIEDLLTDAPGPLRPRLFRELLRIELELRLRRGDRPTLDEYRTCFPSPADEAWIMAAFRQALVATLSQGPGQSTVDLDGPAPAPGAAEGMAVRLNVVEGPHQGLQFDFRNHDTFIVGRSKRAHFRLPLKDKQISRFHFMVEVNPPRCRLMDMASTNGTFVNGRRVDVTDLADGDRIRAGRSTLAVEVRYEGPIPQSPEDSEPQPGPTASTPALSGLSPEPPPGSNTSSRLPDVPGYQIVRELGRGGMGVVYLARSERDGTQVAIKMIIPAMIATGVVLARFLREANILRQLDHPNIVRFLEIGATGELIYFAMEYAPGVNAAELVRKRGRLPVRQAVGLACQALEGLAYAHDRGFVHRDIKPQNLLITRVDGRLRVKLADFGLARVYQESPLSGLTMTGGIGGTVKFMPPEQVTDFRTVRPAADQYALGATLYYLLTARHTRAFPQDRRSQLVTVLHEPPVPIRDHRSSLPEPLARIIHRTIEKRPEKRYRDMATLRKQLLAFAPQDR
jgi:serine/threonine-protein kinase